MKTINKYVSFIFLLPLILCATDALAWNGKVVGVSDGDTIKVLHNGKQVKVRLYGIDTPEKKQAYGQTAKKITASLVAGKTVGVSVIDTDRYGRSVALVTVDGTNVNRKLIKTGYAWIYEQYCKQAFCPEWKNVENKARSAKIGLWQDPNPVPPWNWRKGNKIRGGGSAKSKSMNLFGVGVSSGVLHGNVKSKVFHGASCRYYDCKNCTVVFQSISEALKAGYRPHKDCVE